MIRLMALQAGPTACCRRATCSAGTFFFRVGGLLGRWGSVGELGAGFKGLAPAQQRRILTVVGSQLESHGEPLGVERENLGRRAEKHVIPVEEDPDSS